MTIIQNIVSSIVGASPVSGVTQWIGIPDPTNQFGFNPLEATPPDAPASWPSNDTAGFYYIEVGHVSATDTPDGGDLTDANGNRYGYPDKPRSSVPLQNEQAIAAGSLIKIKGGTQDFGGGTGGRFTANGTQANPIWIIGDPDDKPTFGPTQDRAFQLAENSSYCFFKDLIFTLGSSGQATCISRVAGAGGINHIVIRDCEASGADNVALSTSTCFGISGEYDSRANDIIYYRLNIHEAGNYKAPIPAENDIHGINPGSRAVDRVWVLDSDVYNCGGDSVQVGRNTAQIDAPVETNRTKFVYIAGNRFRGNGENCIDVKQADHVVSSQNKCYDIDGTESAADAGVICSTIEEADHVYYIYNEIYDGGIGIQCTNSGNLHAVGNIIRDITSARASAVDEAGYAFNIRGEGGAFVNNLVYGCGGGVRVESGNPVTEIKNNIFTARTANAGGAGSHDITYEGSGGPAACDGDYNMFDTGNISLDVAGTNYTTVSAYVAAQAGEDNSIEGTPTFTNAAGDDYHLESGSDGLDAGDTALPDIYATYLAEFGVDIKVDYDNENRPAAATDYDLGPYEL